MPKRKTAQRTIEPTFFPTPAAFRKWLAKHHATKDELWVGYYKKDSGKPSITWPESVDEALCFGWIDGVRNRIDAVSYCIRFTPRRARSKWSRVNIGRVKVLVEEGRMQPAGLTAFQARSEIDPEGYSYEQREETLDARYERLLKKNKTAWRFLQAQPPWYRRTVTRWIMSAKREETRERRTEKLLTYSARDEQIPEVLPNKRR